MSATPLVNFNPYRAVGVRPWAENGDVARRVSRWSCFDIDAERVVVHVVSIPKPQGNTDGAMPIADIHQAQAAIPMVTRSTSASVDVRCLVLHNPSRSNTGLVPPAPLWMIASVSSSLIKSVMDVVAHRVVACRARSWRYWASVYLTKPDESEWRQVCLPTDPSTGRSQWVKSLKGPALSGSVSMSVSFKS